MATDTEPYRPQTLSAPVAAAEPAPAAPAPVLDPQPSYFGDRIAFAVWIACALFLGALLTYDIVMGLFR